MHTSQWARYAGTNLGNDITSVNLWSISHDPMLYRRVNIICFIEGLILNDPMDHRMVNIM